MKQRLLWGFLCSMLLFSILLEYMQTTQAVLAAFKYGCMAYGITGISCFLLYPRIKKSNFILGASCILLLLLYTILLIDTFIVHTLPWFPGILRYPLFSTYFPGYLVFILIGAGMAFYPWQNRQHS